MRPQLRRSLCGRGILLAAGPLLAAVIASAGPAPAGQMLARTSRAEPELSVLRSGIEQGDFDEAVRVGERLVAAEPSNSEAHDLLGRAYGRKAEQSLALKQAFLARKARASFERAAALDPSNAAALSDLATYDLLAPALLGGGRSKARREAEEVLKLDPERGHELLGAIAEREGEAVAAEEQYRLALAASTEGLRGRRALSGFFLRRKRFEEARALWHRSGSGDPVPAYELSEIALESGEKLREALEDLEASLRLPVSPDGPREAELRVRLARIAGRLHRPAEAREYLKEALRIEPKHRDWQKELAKLPR